jgi:hypothetical protein
VSDPRPGPAAIAPVRIAGREALGAFAIGLAWALVVRAGPLSLPYFWDEADVYAPGARWLADHDLDPTPGHFPDVWSRGHPPLLYLIAAMVFRALGPGPAIGHAVIVPFTALALASTYVLGAERGGRAVGIGAAVMLATSPLFLSIGAFLLPEMPLCALTTLALVMLSRGNLGAAAGIGVALVGLKETGVGVPIAIAGGLASEAWQRRGVSPPAEMRAARRAIAVSLVPVLALVGFFVWQRATAGYFVFPHHQALFAQGELELTAVGRIVPSVLGWHGRWVVAIAAAIGAVVIVVRGAGSSRLRLDATNAAIVLLAAGNAIFFARMFWLERYALPIHPPVCVLLVLVIVEVASRLGDRARAIATAAPIAIAACLGIASLHDLSGAPEHTFAFADVVRTHREALQRIEREERGGEEAIATTWPLTTEMREPWLGYVDVPLRSVHVDHVGDETERPIDRVLIDRSSRAAEALRALARREGMRWRWTVERGSAPGIELWGR